MLDIVWCICLRVIKMSSVKMWETLGLLIWDNFGCAFKNILEIDRKMLLVEKVIFSTFLTTTHIECTAHKSPFKTLVSIWYNSTRVISLCQIHKTLLDTAHHFMLLNSNINLVKNDKKCIWWCNVKYAHFIKH